MKRSVIITQANDYAMRTAFYLSGLPEGISITSRELAEKLDVPYAFLAKLLQRLTKAGITASRKGKSGGITLIRKPDQINLADIFEAVDGVPVLRNCVIDPEACFQQKHCQVSPALNRIQSFLDKEFAKVTLDQLFAE